MTDIRRVYWLTAVFGLIGFVSYFVVLGPRPAFGFLLGAMGSFGNLWLFGWLARSIAPGEAPRKPWQAGAFIGRYLLLFTIGYVIVKALDVNPLAVILGLLASTAGVLLSSIVELIQSLLGRRAH
jgi:ATP synthase I chain